MGVVYHSNYLVWCEIGRTDFIRELGTSYAEMEAAGITLAVAEATLRYHSGARYDDEVSVSTTLADVRSRSLTFDYLITNARTGARLVSARTTLVSVDRDGRTIALPADIRQSLASGAS